ncbi:MAG: helix-turn-helix domain-containing protein [Mycobacterium sp.]|nr:helix-turn-helix domain-containing protein [Mycobacterium sp.]
MKPTWEPVRDDPSAQKLWQDVLRPIAKEMSGGADDLTARIAARLDSEGHQRPDTQFLAEIPANVADSVRQLAQIISEGATPRGLELPASALAVARARVQQGVPLAYFMRSYRLAQDVIWSWMFDRINASTASPADQRIALELATRWLFAYMDSSLVLAEQVYEDERESWLRSAAASRTAAIDDVLAGREGDVQRASTKLRHDLNRDHVAICLWLESTAPESDPQKMLAGACSAFARLISAENTLTQPVGSLALNAWVSRSQRFGPTQRDAEELARALRLPPGLKVSVGESGWGIEGFRNSHEQALHARRVALLAGPHANQVTRYADVAVAALASVDTRHAASFVSRVLGPLAAADDDTYRIAMTLAVYLEENRSPARAAKRLTVHPNTVTYRVKQAESVLGRNVDTDALEVSVALALLPLLAGMADG